MAKDIRVSEPSLEMQEKIKRARRAIASQKMRTVKCPYADKWLTPSRTNYMFLFSEGTH